MTDPLDPGHSLMPPTACTRPPWWQTLERIDARPAAQQISIEAARKARLLRQFEESLAKVKGEKK